MGGGPVSSGEGIGANAPKNKFAGIAITSFAAFGGILYGYDTGVINGLQGMDVFKCTFGSGGTPPNCSLTSGETSLIVSILSAGTFVGALLAAPTGDIIGRKFGIIMACAVFCLGVALQVASSALTLFVVGRVFAGIGVGLVSVLVPMYQSECAPKWIRGAVVSAYQWAITIGILLAAIINNATATRPDHSSYQIPISIQFVWAFILVSGMLVLPESPRWLIKKGRDEAAAKSLSRLTSLNVKDPQVELELNDIRTNLEEEMSLGKATYADCFRMGHNKILLRTLTGILLQAFQQLSGINFIIYYGTQFFMNSGIQNSFLIAIVTGVVNVVMTIPGIWGVERFGRRRLLLVGATGMLICEFIIAIVGVATPKTNIASQKVLIAFVCVYIAFFASTWGPIAWVICGEIFPLNVRAKAMSLSIASNWLWNFGIGFATPYLVNDGPGNAGLGSNVFFIWGATCTGGLIFTYFMIPETKGLSLEAIDLMYQSTVPLKSHAYRRQLFAGEINVPNQQGKNIGDVKDESDHTSHEEKV